MNLPDRPSAPRFFAASLLVACSLLLVACAAGGASAPPSAAVASTGPGVTATPSVAPEPSPATNGGAALAGVPTGCYGLGEVDCRLVRDHVATLLTATDPADPLHPDRAVRVRGRPGLPDHPGRPPRRRRHRRVERRSHRLPRQVERRGPRGSPPGSLRREPSPDEHAPAPGRPTALRTRPLRPVERRGPRWQLVGPDRLRRQRPRRTRSTRPRAPSCSSARTRPGSPRRVG